MYGNLSQTIVQVPYMFNILSNLTSAKFAKTRYREPPLLDTFSQIKNINKRLNNRYFRLNDHFKENAVYKDLNYNNNKRYTSPVTKLESFTTFHNSIFSDCPDFKNRLKRNNSQIQLMSNKNNISIHSNKTISKDYLDNNSNYFNIENKYNENNRYIDGEEKNNILDINDNQSNVEENKNENNIIEDENKKIDKYMKKLKDKKPTNLKELKELLDMNYVKEEKKKILFPKIRGMNKSMSQDDLFIKTLDKKIESLTMIKPEIKNSIYRRKKNIILKRDYDLFHKIYANHKKIYPIKENINNNAFLQ